MSSSKTKTQKPAVNGQCIPPELINLLKEHQPELQELLFPIIAKNRLLVLERKSEELQSEAGKVENFIESSGKRCWELVNEIKALEVDRVDALEEGDPDDDVTSIMQAIADKQKEIDALVEKVAISIKTLDSLGKRHPVLREEAFEIHESLKGSWSVELPALSQALSGSQVISGQTYGGKIYRLSAQIIDALRNTTGAINKALADRDRILKEFPREQADLNPMKELLVKMEAEHARRSQKVNSSAYATSLEKDDLKNTKDDIDRMRQRIQSREEDTKDDIDRMRQRIQSREEN